MKKTESILPVLGEFGSQAAGKVANEAIEQAFAWGSIIERCVKWVSKTLHEAGTPAEKYVRPVYPRDVEEALRRMERRHK